MFPRASWTNLLASSPMVVVGLASSATAIENARTAEHANGSAGPGVLGAAGLAYDGGAYRRLATANKNGDSQSGAEAGVVSFILQSGAGYDRAKNNSATNISATTQPFALQVAGPGEWSISNNAGAGNQSTASKAAGAAGVRHVLRSFDFSISATAAAVVTINIRDGATGAGTVLRTYTLAVAANESLPWGLAGLNVFGSAATAMTIEQSAGVANCTVAVNASGYSTV